MRETSEIWLSIGIVHENGDIAYAGNYDEIVSVTICGQSEHERFGYENAMVYHNEFVKNHVEPLMFDNFHDDEYGPVMYSLDLPDYNRLLMKFCSTVSVEDVMDYINKLGPCLRGKLLTDGSGQSVLVNDFVIRHIIKTAEETEFRFDNT
ncbi:MAG: hypothetical protein COA84_13955 [Robiginitomaculum sp.]|nr:MAG: hypothetical protein COA84_13955 [Robiginitomaculum sp.]